MNYYQFYLYNYLINLYMGSSILDKYSYLHFATGILAYFWGISIQTWFILNILFEIIENTNIGIYTINNYFKFCPGGKPSSDTMINRVSDIIFSLCGWISSYYLDKLY